MLTAIALTLMPVSSLANDYSEYIESIATEYDIPAELITAVIETESQFNEDAKNGNCVGLMQVNPRWQKERMKELGVDDLKNPHANILVGTDYLVDLINDYETVENALTIYNMGNKGIELVKRGKTSKYARTIVKRTEELIAERTK